MNNVTFKKKRRKKRSPELTDEENIEREFRRVVEKLEKY